MGFLGFRGIELSVIQGTIFSTSRCGVENTVQFGI